MVHKILASDCDNLPLLPESLRGRYGFDARQRLETEVLSKDVVAVLVGSNDMERYTALVMMRRNTFYLRRGNDSCYRRLLSKSTNGHFFTEALSTYKYKSSTCSRTKGWSHDCIGLLVRQVCRCHIKGKGICPLLCFHIEDHKRFGPRRLCGHDTLKTR